MRLVLQRGVGDCGLAALSTVLEQSYEDVYVAMASVEQAARGKSGLQWRHLMRAGRVLGVKPTLKARADLEADEGLLAVKWRKPHKHPFNWHIVSLGHGVIVDSADGTVLPADEYLTRYRAAAGRLLELQ